MKILIIESNSDFQHSLFINLQAEGYVIDQSYDGIHGLYMAITNKYDLIIMGTNLEKKTSIEVLKRIRADKNMTPIISISDKDNINLKIEMFQDGIDDFIVNPFSFSELNARIKAILRRPKTIKSVKLYFNDLSLNVETHTVKRKNKKILLTRKEFLLLELLMRNPDIVLTRVRISEDVWDINADINTRSIETHISNLRKKINSGFTQKYITTIFGKGYKLRTSN